MAATVCTQDGGRGWVASGENAGTRACGGSGGEASSRQRGQSMPMAPDFAGPPSVWTTILTPPALVQTTSRVLGWISGDATAAPRQSANHANTHQRSRVRVLRVFMVGQYRRAKGLVLDIHHVCYQAPITSRCNSCFTLLVANPVPDNTCNPGTHTFNLPATPSDRAQAAAVALPQPLWRQSAPCNTGAFMACCGFPFPL